MTADLLVAGGFMVAARGWSPSGFSHAVLVLAEMASVKCRWRKAVRAVRVCKIDG